jgi:hypothetical protein
MACRDVRLHTCIQFIRGLEGGRVQQHHRIERRAFLIVGVDARQIRFHQSPARDLSRTQRGVNLSNGFLFNVKLGRPSERPRAFLSKKRQ